MPTDEIPDLSLPAVPTRRDDLEAAALMLIHILTPGGLHWTRNGVPKTDGEHERLKQSKKAARPEDLCRGMPSEFEEFLRYTRKLRFADMPDYEHWREEFRSLMSERGYGEDEAFIWPPPPQPVVRRSTSMNDGCLLNVLTAAHEHRTSSASFCCGTTDALGQ
jgi:hypothetical protein